MKNLPYYVVVLLFFSVGCNLFSNSGNGGTQSNTAANSERTANKASTPTAGASPAASAEREFSEDDYVGRWKTNSDMSDHFIEFREDGTGTITLKDGDPKNQAKQNFTWKYEAKHAVFTVKSPVVNAKIIDSGTLSIHAKVIEDGKKLKTDFSAFTRSKGEDIFDKQ